MLEKDIERAVCDYAEKKYDAIAYKFTSPARRSVPDRLIIFPGAKKVFIEFKATGKSPTEKQHREISRLIERGHRVLVIDDIEMGKYIVDEIGSAPVPEGSYWT